MDAVTIDTFLFVANNTLIQALDVDTINNDVEVI